MVKFQGLTTEINIRNPDVGDQIKMPLNVMAKRSMDGTKRLYKMGTVKKQMSLQFSNLNIPQRNEVENFLIQNRGQLITYTDQYGQDWVGYLMQDPTFTHNGRHNNVFPLSLEVVSI
jgi:hypothetical protein